MSGAKEDEIYVVPPSASGGGWELTGVFFRDTVYFDRWAWHSGDARFLSQVSSGNMIREYHCLTAPDRSQRVGLMREVIVRPDGFADCWTATNYTRDVQVVELRLEASPRMVDLFAMRLNPQSGETAEPLIEVATTPDGARVFSRTAADGVALAARLHCDRGMPENMCWTLALPPLATQALRVDVAITSSDTVSHEFPALPGYDAWRASFGALAGKNPAVDQAIDDLRALLLRTEFGPYPAAGMPIFINFFGRDALIAAMMILEWRPDMMRAVLLFLADTQGRTVDPFREEEPGKILHEIRRGELSRTNRIPFGRYYGSVDSTPLFLMAADAYLAANDDRETAAQLRPAIEAATAWLVDHLGSASGLATFHASGSGLAVQSWKDSANSMVDENGEQARQPIAVAEVQGYAYAALQAASRMLPDQAERLVARADALREAFHRQFWLADMGTYAMALDADLKPLRVLSSDPGHLLWAGIVPNEIAPTLVATLMGDALWSGWGLRTLGSGEVAYNPVSYHNGSVWPHDTGLFAMGLARYGFDGELRVVAQAMLDLAAASPGRHIPELISGFSRAEHDEPVPYTHANAPQAWAAAAVIRMASYLHSGEDDV